VKRACTWHLFFIFFLKKVIFDRFVGNYNDFQQSESRIDINVYRMTYVYDIHLPRSLLTYDSVRNNYDNLCISAFLPKVIDKLKKQKPRFCSYVDFLKNFVFFITNRMAEKMQCNVYMYLCECYRAIRCQFIMINVHN